MASECWNQRWTAESNRRRLLGAGATGDSTITVKTKVPYAPFLVTRAASIEGFWFMPVEPINNRQVQNDPAGTGPWVFKTGGPGVAMRWDRNDEFYEENVLWLDAPRSRRPGSPRSALTAAEPRS